MSKLIEKWEKTKLLNGLDDFNKIECVNSLEKLFILLLDGKKECVNKIDKIYGNGFFSGCILEIVRCLYDADGIATKVPSMSMEWLIEDFAEYCREKREMFLATPYYYAIAREAEFIISYVESLKGKMG